MLDFAKRIKQYFIKRKGSVEYAKYLGVNIHDSVRIFGTIEWGTEPWLISIGRNTSITNKVVFLTHDESVKQVKALSSKYNNEI